MVSFYGGLHPGAPILVDGRTAGGVACLLTTDQGPTHLLTAGHLFARDQLIPVHAAAALEEPSVLVGSLQLNLLDHPPGPLGVCLDAALVQLTPEGCALVRESQDPVRLERIQPAALCHALSTRAFLPTRGKLSSTVKTCADSFGPWTMHFEENGRHYQVLDVIRVPSITQPGDSGTILAQLGEDRVAIGLCIGWAQGLSLFEPIDRAITELSAHTGLPLCLWSPTGGGA